jgi:hypothetical protein
MNKLIIENKSDLSMIDVLELANKVLKLGRISNNDTQYCYLVSFEIQNNEYHIVSDLNKKSDKLTIYKVPQK